MPDAAAGAQGFEILPRPADLLVLREPLELQSLEMGHGGLGLLFSFSTHLLSIASRRPWVGFWRSPMLNGRRRSLSVKWHNLNFPT